MDEFKMTPHRPYLLKAFYDWILDNDCTPFLVVNANYFGTEVPQDFISDGQIVLNIAPHAVVNLQMNFAEISFNARFSGKPQKVFVPMGAAVAIYARENGAGTVFEPEDIYELDEDGSNSYTEESSSETKIKEKPTLTIVK